MKMLFIFLTVILISLSLKPGCERKDAWRDCIVICDNLGFDFDHAVKTGIFAYNCQCKHRPSDGLKINQKP